jgi:hypothetical protein
MKLKLIISTVCLGFLLFDCNTRDNNKPAKNENKYIDTLNYAYRATYSSDLTVPAKPEIGQMVLTVWKMFENKQIDSLKKYYADTVTYDNSDGHRFYGSSAALLNFAKKDVEGLDSLRFDISMWESLHLNDRNEDWVFIWAAERRYGKDGKADTSLIHEQWKVDSGRVSYFNQYIAKPARK